MDWIDSIWQELFSREVSFDFSLKIWYKSLLFFLICGDVLGFLIVYVIG